MDKFHSFEQMKALLSNDALRLIELIGYKNAVLLSAHFGRFSYELAKDARHLESVELVGREDADKFRQFIEVNFPDINDYAEFLSDSQRELFDLLGGENFNKLCERLGGKGIYLGGLTSIKKNGKNFQILKDIIGEKEAVKCFSTFRYNFIYLPQLRILKVKVRDKAIVKDYEKLIRECQSQRDVARILSSRYGITERTVYDILKNTAI